nr:hypothetical protein [Maliibacterium massiliense]
MDEGKGAARTFPLCGQVLQIPAQMDAFNTYRLRFRDIAATYTEHAQVAYRANIHDLDSFFMFFMRIYEEKRGYVIRQAFDILIAQGVWTVTCEQFAQQHQQEFHLAIDDYNEVIDAFNQAIADNQRRIAGVMGYVPSLVGGGFGLAGALKGIATATAFNLVRDGIEASALKNANVKPAQREAIYRRIDPERLLDHIFMDCWQAYLLLVWTLRENGRDIWWPARALEQQADSVFENLSHPSFPQDQLLPALLHVLRTDPFNEAYFAFMLARLGRTPEVCAIKDYFGYAHL